MCTCIKSLSGIVFRAFLICLASLASLGGTATAAVDASAERVSGVSVQRDFSSRVQALTEHAPGEHFSGVALGAWDNSARIAGPFWASAGDGVEAAWLGVSTRYVDSAGFYLEGVDAGEESPRPGRTDSPFELNDSHAHSGQNAVEYVTATGVKSQLYANMGLNRSTREGWAINGNVVGTLPEPGTLLLMGLGLLGLGLARRRAARSAH